MDKASIKKQVEYLFEDMYELLDQIRFRNQYTEKARKDIVDYLSDIHEEFSDEELFTGVDFKEKLQTLTETCQDLREYLGK